MCLTHFHICFVWGRKQRKTDSCSKGECTMMGAVCAAVTFILDCMEFISQSPKKPVQNPPPGCQSEAMGLALMCYFQRMQWNSASSDLFMFSAITGFLTNISLSFWKAGTKMCRGTMKVFSAWRNGCCSALCYLLEAEVTGLYKIVNTGVQENSWGFPIKFGVDR